MSEVTELARKFISRGKVAALDHPQTAIAHIKGLCEFIESLNTRAPAQPDAQLVERLLDLLKSVGHHGIDVGYGEHQIGIYEVKEAQLLYEEVAALSGQGENND